MKHSNGQRRPSSSRRRLISATDLLLLAILPGLVGTSWLLHERLWKPICLALAYLHVRLGGPRTQGQGGLWRATQPFARSNDLQVSLTRGGYETTLQVLRDYRPGGWRPKIQVLGREHIEHALEGGRGAILWVPPFLFSDLVTKMGLHQAGFAVSHLSLVTHGYSTTRFGVLFLNKLRTKVEDRYLRERILISPEARTSALRALRQRLRENGIVSLTASTFGHRIIELPFLNGVLRLANGAPSLAVSSEAPLLPVFTVPAAAGGFEVHVQSCLTLPQGRQP